MLKSYEALYEKGKVKWLSDRPDVSSARILVTVLEESIPDLSQSEFSEKASLEEKKKYRRMPPPEIAGKGKTLGDIVSPIVDEQDWECLK